MNTTIRNQQMKEEFLLDRRSTTELARMYGMTERRVRQILEEQDVRINQKSRIKSDTSQPISKLHIRIGQRLYDYRFTEGFELEEVSLSLNMTKVRIRKIEKGEQELELMDLQNIARYLGMTVSQLIEE